MEQPAETISPDDGTGAGASRRGSSQLARATLTEALMGPRLVVVQDELAQDGFQLAPAEDEQVVQDFPAYGPHRSLGERVCPRRSIGQANDLYALAAEDLIEGSGELGVSVPEQELSPEFALLKLPG